MGVALAILTIIFLLVAWASRQRIKIAVEVISEASDAIVDLPWMIFFPFWPLLCGVAYVILWCYASLYIMSVSIEVQVDVPDGYLAEQWPLRYPGRNLTYTNTEWDATTQNAAAFQFFHLLWTLQFLVYFTFMVIAGTVANWYFSRKDESGARIRGDNPDQLPESPTLLACYRTCRFHMGSLAFGSFVIAAIKFTRYVLNYIERKTRISNAKCVHKIIFCTVMCCLSCLEYCLDKVNQGAFVWIAIWGGPFVPAACSSFELLWSNANRFFVLNTVTEIILTVGKVLISLAVAGMGGAILAWGENYGDAVVSSISLPVFMMFVCAWYVSTMFMELFDTAVDTIFICFLVDEQYNTGGSPDKEMYARPELQELIGRYADLNAQEFRKYEEMKHTRPGQKTTYVEHQGTGGGQVDVASTDGLAEESTGPDPNKGGAKMV